MMENPEQEEWWWKYLKWLAILLFFALLVLTSRCTSQRYLTYGNNPPKHQKGIQDCPEAQAIQRKKDELFWHKITHWSRKDKYKKK